LGGVRMPKITEDDKLKLIKLYQEKYLKAEEENDKLRKENKELREECKEIRILLKLDNRL
jgi:hypothetical protein